jgi:hypothetical protein
LICAECLCDHISSGLNEVKVLLSCAAKRNCGGTYTEPFIQRALSNCPELQNRLDRLRNHQVMTQMIKQNEGEKVNIVECPFCEYFCIMENPNDKVLIINNLVIFC